VNLRNEFAQGIYRTLSDHVDLCTMTNHAVFQILSTTVQGVEAGSGWFSEEANAMAKKQFPSISQDAVYGLTNAHVVAGSQALYSRHSVARKSDLPLSVVGVCQEADLALVKLSGEAKTFLEKKLLEKTGLTKIPTIEMINSDACMPAQYNATDHDASVVAVGYPLGCEFQTTTVGVVEAWKRVPGHSESLFLAHTATIQPGNSGGVLLYRNKAVGINSLKATSANVDNLNMSICSRTVQNYLPHLLDGERQSELTSAVVRLAHHLRAQGLEMALLDASTKSKAYLGDPARMEAAYNSAMSLAVPEKHRTLADFVKTYARQPGFHSLWSKVTQLIHTGNTAKLQTMACQDTFHTKCCGYCQTSSQKCNDCRRNKRLGEPVELCAFGECDANMYTSCQSAVPAKIVHSVSMGFDYKPMSRLTAKALGVKETKGVVVSSSLHYGPTSELQRYDVVTAVKTTADGLCSLDENGEVYKKEWGLSLSLSDLVERAPLGSEVAFQIRRGDKNMVLRWDKIQQNKPACRALDASEQHLNSAITVGGCTFKVLRMNDLNDPRIASSPAAAHALNPHKRHLERVIVADVSPASAAYHNYSLAPGQILEEVNMSKLGDASPWNSFCQKLVASVESGVALLATECGGVDTVRVTEQEASAIAQYLHQSTMI